MNKWWVGLTLLIILLSLGVIYMVSKWDLTQIDNQGEKPEAEWVLLQPTKCTQIPWRKEWAFLNQKMVDEFPLEKELEILKNYYEKRGIQIVDIRLTYQATDPLCTACGCPEPFVFAIKTPEKDAAKLAVSGFKILDTSNPYIFTGPLYRQSVEQPLSLVQETDCQKVFATHTFLDELLGSKQDSCYIQVAIGSQNVNVCQKIWAAPAKNNCIIEVAVSLRSAEICALLTQQGPLDACLSSVAGVTRNAELCDQVTNSTTKYFCKIGVEQ